MHKKDEYFLSRITQICHQRRACFTTINRSDRVEYNLPLTGVLAKEKIQGMYNVDQDG